MAFSTTAIVRPIHLASFFAEEATSPPINNATIITRNKHRLLAFDDSTDEFALFHGVFHYAYTIGDINIHFDWVAASATTGDVVWAIEFQKIVAGGHDIDSDSFASMVTATGSANATNGIVTRTTMTLTNAQVDSVAGGDPFVIRTRRNASNASDTLVGDAQLLRLSLERIDV